MAEDLAQAMRVVWFSGIALPGLLAAGIAVWKWATRPGEFEVEDGALGFDLMFAAIGSQLAFFPMADPHALPIAWGLLKLVLLLTVFSGIGVWAWGYEIESGKVVMRPIVVIAHNFLGMAVLSGVVLGNVYWVIALERFPRWML